MHFSKLSSTFNHTVDRRNNKKEEKKTWIISHIVERTRGPMVGTGLCRIYIRLILDEAVFLDVRLGDSFRVTRRG